MTPLRKWMKDTGTGPSALGSMVGASRVHVWRIADNGEPASPELALKIEQVTGVDAASLSPVIKSVRQAAA